VTSPPGSVVCQKCRLEYPGEALFCPNCGTARHRDETGADPMVGTTVADRYQLIERIGYGASGTIYRAEHVTLRRKVAVKVLHHELSRDDLAIERFRREATTVGQIENEHIVEIFDFGRTTDGRLYLAMEFLEGETLSDAMDKGPLRVDLAVDILDQLGEALMEAHAMGYVHRDLRPRNIFLALRRGKGGRPFVKLLDFGLSKLVEKEGEAASTSLGMTFGDPHYMSPEQARGDFIDRRADIYSLGCIAYQMLVGEAPFSGGKVFDILTRHVDAQPVDIRTRRADIPEWLAHAVMRMLAKRPDERFITVYRLIEALKLGRDAGEVMTDELAYSAETTPPPSVSLAMEKLAARSASDEEGTDDDDAVGDEAVADAASGAAVASPAPGPAAAAPPAPAPAPARGSFAAVPGLANLAPARGVAAVVPVNGGRTAIGVGNLGMLSAAPAATASEGKRGKKPSADQTGGLSAAWFADGDAMENDDPLDTGARRKLEKAREKAPSQTAILAADDLERESRRRWGVAAVVGGGLVLIAVLAFALWPSGDDEDPRAAASADAGAVAAAPAPVVPAPVVAAMPDAAPPAVIPTPTPPPTAEKKTDKKTEKTEKKPGRFDHIGEDTPEVTPEPESEPEPEPTPEKTTDDEPDSSADTGKSDFFAKLGERDLANNDLLGAATNFNKARELDPNNAAAIIGLGEIALGQGSAAAAIGHLKKATKLRPGDARAHTLLGEAYLAAGDNTQAAASFKRALQIDPDSTRARDGYNEAAGTDDG
jgi:serine/threonine-protein kinase